LYFCHAGVIALVGRTLATEIRHLHRHDVLKPRNCFSEARGSSAIPHKRNPVLSEKLTGLARMMRAYVDAGDGKRRAVARARNISHSAVERVIGPDPR